MPPASRVDTDPLFEFLDDDGPAAAVPRDTWHILVVDDEDDVREATRLAVRGLVIEGRQIRLSHASDAQEAYRILSETADIAVVLLDVVMETEDAGLNLVRRIREDLRNTTVRIVLRTGQPGYAPEIETIRTYDINDYKTKSELTRTRLFTTLAVAIRSYRQVQQLEMNRRGLELIIAGSTGLAKARALSAYAEGVVTQLGALLNTSPDGLICAADLAGHSAPRVIAAAGRFRALIQSPLDSLPDPYLREILSTCLSSRRHMLDGGMCLYFAVGQGSGIAAYVDGVESLDPLSVKLLELFCANVTVGFENVLLQQKLYDFAYTDQLLNLPNRQGFIRLANAQTFEGETILALVDLDDFAEMNTVLDHRFGDLVLDAVSRRMAEVFGPPILLARIGSDTFALVGPADQITCARIEGIFATPVLVEGQVLRVSATASLVRVSSRTSASAEVLKDASIALKQAKLLKRGRATLFSQDLSAAARERIHMLTELRAAFSSERLFLAYQPQVDLLSGKVLGAEALLRWQTETGKLIPPDQFIPLAEQSGLTVPIGEWVLRTACHQLNHLMALGYSGFRMAVNVSHTQFREPGFVPALGRALTDCRIDPTCLELELTESVAIGHIDTTAAKIQEIRAMGITVAMDDFGTGYSSLSVLKQLNVDHLKIDRSFVQEITEQGDSSGIAELVIGLGRQMSMVTIAEGVETEHQRRQLIAMGCQEGQGFLFARPMAWPDFQRWMATHHDATPPAGG